MWYADSFTPHFFFFPFENTKRNNNRDNVERETRFIVVGNSKFSPSTHPDDKRCQFYNINNLLRSNGRPYRLDGPAVPGGRAGCKKEKNKIPCPINILGVINIF